MRFDYDTETLYLDLDEEVNIRIDCYNDHIVLMVNLNTYNYNLFGTTKDINTINNSVLNRADNLTHPFVMNLFKTFHGNLKQRICFVNLDGIDYQLMLDERPYPNTGFGYFPNRDHRRFQIMVLRIL